MFIKLTVEKILAQGIGGVGRWARHCNNQPLPLQVWGKITLMPHSTQCTITKDIYIRSTVVIQEATSNWNIVPLVRACPCQQVVIHCSSPYPTSIQKLTKVTSDVACLFPHPGFSPPEGKESCSREYRGKTKYGIPPPSCQDSTKVLIRNIQLIYHPSEKVQTTKYCQLMTGWEPAALTGDAPQRPLDYWETTSF